ncbi:GntR family transcriptional regulator [Kitasatospora sp. NPDC051984]|uniref:GntR family transcriptional regulator n=1 Tax=Kitasatospora sp. NPDC051984 TaxID=3364059 RepID=UPI0037C80B02
MQKVPKWQALADDLAAKIREGVYRPGDSLPLIREQVAAGMGSKTTVQAAYSALESEGLVTTTRGHGTSVRRRPPRLVRRHQDRYAWEKRRALLDSTTRRESGVVEHDTGLAHEEIECHAAFNTVQADDDLAGRFGVDVGTLLLHRHYWHSTPGSPTAMSLIDSYLVHAVAARNPALLDSKREPWPGGTQHQLRTVGIEIDVIEDGIRTRLATPEESRHLAIPSASPVLILDKTSISTEGEVVEYSHVILPGDRTEFRYSVQLERWTQ